MGRRFESCRTHQNFFKVRYLRAFRISGCTWHSSAVPNFVPTCENELGGKVVVSKAEYALADLQDAREHHPGPIWCSLPTSRWPNWTSRR
jgi:hypothetical protein